MKCSNLPAIYVQVLKHGRVVWVETSGGNSVYIAVGVIGMHYLVAPQEYLDSFGQETFKKW